MTRREFSENSVPYDLAALAALVGDDPDAVAETLELFVRVAREWLVECGAARAAGDLVALARLGHRMKSSARAIGATLLADASLELERVADRGDRSAAQTAAVHAEVALGAVLAALDREPARHSSKDSSASGRENR